MSLVFTHIDPDHDGRSKNSVSWQPARTRTPYVTPDDHSFVPLPLQQARHVIDRIDDTLLLLVAMRRRLVDAVGVIKRRRHVQAHDPLREHAVHRRAGTLSARLGLPAPLAHALMDLLIADGRAQQGIVALSPAQPKQGSTAMTTYTPATPSPSSFASLGERLGHAALRAVPPPQRLAPLLRVLPPILQQRALELAMSRVLAPAMASGDLDFMLGRRLGISVSDLGLHWVIELRGEQLCVCAPGIEAEATVRGSATDLLLLASRLEDADTLFFQRRLELTGDTELGLTARNLLDRLPWEDVPLGLRIALNRSARFARAARAVYRDDRSGDTH
ncbi:MAG: hypothetical protein CVV15_09855 [Gammaproteobacteria bacterium HGW-Gammaproteobacteria-5]|jgi:predicted lipid carrier protein YhbT/chorismate mutase|nr:MAG: hypothetical protein CVV15_09855 [Gammaproteobacteria bacterium HGW-Gammaproteobacteria-5]